MKILAHRGWWDDPVEQNGLAALEKALAAGHGIELDIRDLLGEIVVSHDSADVGALPLEQVVEMARAYLTPESGMRIAVNVKSDGLAAGAGRILSPLMDNCFYFDMSIPDMLVYLDVVLSVFARHSDWEQVPVGYDHASGVWLDQLSAPWITAGVIERHLEHDKMIAVVSDELHGRDAEALWSVLSPFKSDHRLMLCTDYIDAAGKYFD